MTVQELGMMMGLEPETKLPPGIIGMHDRLRRVLGFFNRLIARNESLTDQLGSLEHRYRDLSEKAAYLDKYRDELGKREKEMVELRIKAIQLEAQRDAMVEAHRVAVGIAAGHSSEPQYATPPEAQ